MGRDLTEELRFAPLRGFELRLQAERAFQRLALLGFARAAVLTGRDRAAGVAA